MGLPPKYVPDDVMITIEAYVRHRDSRQFHPRRFEVLVPIIRTMKDIKESWSVLYHDHGLTMLGFPIEVDYDTKALSGVGGVPASVA